MWAIQERYTGCGCRIWLWILVVFLVVLGSVLAVAEASLTRMTRFRALASWRRKRRNAVKTRADRGRPARY